MALPKKLLCHKPKPNPAIFPHFTRKPPNPPPMIHLRDGVGNREAPLMVAELAAEHGRDEFCGRFRAICDCAVKIVHSIFVMHFQCFLQAHAATIFWLAHAPTVQRAHIKVVMQMRDVAAFPQEDEALPDDIIRLLAASGLRLRVSFSSE